MKDRDKHSKQVIEVDGIEYSRYSENGRWHAMKCESTYVNDKGQKEINEYLRLQQVEKREKRLEKILSN